MAEGSQSSDAPSDDEAGEAPFTGEASAGKGQLALWDTAADAAAAEPGHPTVWHRALRSVRQRERATTANYILSLLADAAFVRGVADALPGWPVLANLRCGAWYVPPDLARGTAYFKSTDGHAGTWGFSAARLNWHVATLAGTAGGVVVVDSTRRGKALPDALAKTVPIWCAVLSALALAGARAPPARGAAAALLRLPPAVSPSEAAQIGARMDSWVEALEAALSAPMRAQLVRALAGRALVPVWRAPADGPPADAAAVAAVAAATLGGDGVVGALPVVCVCASARVSTAASRTAHSWTYIQGAGDDDEAWAHGLTPAAFWAAAAELGHVAARDAAACERAVDSVRARAALGAAAAAAACEGAAVRAGGLTLRVAAWTDALGATAVADGGWLLLLAPAAECARAAAAVGGGGDGGGGGGDLMAVAAAPHLAAAPAAEAAEADAEATNDDARSRPRALALPLEARAGSRATGHRSVERPSHWRDLVLPRALQLGSRALLAEGEGEGEGEGEYADGDKAGLAALARLRSEDASQAQRPQPDAHAHARTQSQPCRCLTVAHGGGVAEEAAVAVAVALLVGLFAPAADARAPSGLRASAAAVCAFARGGADGVAAGVGAARASKATVRARLLLLQGQRGSSALPLSRALAKQLNCFFMPPV